jgi:hypothetical protein
MDDSKTPITPLDMLRGYLGRGWALVPLHDVSAGHCSCRRGPDCSSAGKHPRYEKWQEEGQLVRDELVLAALLQAHPEWNWGVATGRASGIWVLDYDAAHEAGVLAWLLDRGLDFADIWTLTLGPTGGGGRHYVFELPPDFEVRGSQTRNRYGLPPGLDVRGHHGQIVVAPSVSGKGPYGGVLIDAPVRRAPSWLEEMLRPAPDTPPVEKPQDLYGLLAQPVGPDARALAYARSAVTGALRELAEAPEGTRNDTAYRVACRLHELANASWSGYDESVLLAAWWDSRWWHAVGRDSADGVWRRARDRVGGAAAILPPDYGTPETVPILDFPAPRVAGASHGGGELPFLDPGGVDGGVPVDPVQELIDRMLTPERLRALPPPRPLVRGLLDLNTCAWLIGKPGSCKSFVALDLAVHVGRGDPWRGRPVHQGLVIYIAAEGSTGMSLRVAAIEREYGEIKDVLVLPESIPADERKTPKIGAWSVLEAAVARLRPVMIIIDTQARVTTGLDENSNSDMSYYAAQADRLKRASGACVLTVHHQGRSGTNARGASAIDGAQDVELRVERADGSMLLKLHVEKQKDQVEGPPIEMALAVSPGGVSPDGRDLSSLVIVPELEAGPLPLLDPGDPMPTWRRRAIALYHLIQDRYNAGAGGSEAEIKKAFKALPDVAALSSEDGKAKAWTRAWNGTDTAPGLVPRGLIAKKSDNARFKVIVLEDQTAEGVLTPNDLKNPTLPPEGWNMYLPDYSPRE